jgi:hypothetical protein
MLKFVLLLRPLISSLFCLLLRLPLLPVQNSSCSCSNKGFFLVLLLLQVGILQNLMNLDVFDEIASDFWSKYAEIMLKSCLNVANYAEIC